MPNHINMYSKKKRKSSHNKRIRIFTKKQKNSRRKRRRRIIRKSRKVEKTSRKPRKSVKIKQNKSTLDNKMIWGRLGSVYNPKTKKYLRLGTTSSFNVIRDELVRDKEWYKRVKFMAKRRGAFGDKLKTLL